MIIVACSYQIVQCEQFLIHGNITILAVFCVPWGKCRLFQVLAMDCTVDMGNMWHRNFGFLTSIRKLNLAGCGEGSSLMMVIQKPLTTKFTWKKQINKKNTCDLVWKTLLFTLHFNSNMKDYKIELNISLIYCLWMAGLPIIRIHLYFAHN